MAERDGARRVTQRQLDAGGPVPPAAETAPQEPTISPSEAVALQRAEAPPIPRVSSGDSLLERQGRWLRERVRFEQAQSSPEPEGQGSK